MTDAHYNFIGDAEVIQPDGDQKTKFDNIKSDMVTGREMEWIQQKKPGQ